MRHHTKDKGDQGVGMVIGHLARHGIDVALPISEHFPFDCIAISPRFELCRLSVKYRSLRGGCVKVPLRSSWADRHGSHTRAHDKSLYDGTAIYCPDNGECYYVRMDEVRGQHIILRIKPARNHQKAGVTQAHLFTNPERLFTPR